MKTKATIGMAVMGMPALLAGCDSKSGTQSEPTASVAAPLAQEHGMGMMEGKCPMQVPTTTVKSADVDSGVALAFTTSTGDVAELRQRVRRMAEMHNHQHDNGGMMMRGHGPDVVAEHAHGSGAGPGDAADGRSGMMMGGGMMMPAATASVEDIEGGARLVLRPKEAGKLEALREHARMRAERMANGECPMMCSGAAGQAKPPPSAGDMDREAHPPSPQGK